MKVCPTGVIKYSSSCAVCKVVSKAGWVRWLDSQGLGRHINNGIDKPKQHYVDAIMG